MGRLIMVSEAAKRVGVTSQTIRNWGTNKVLRLIRNGNGYYVDEDTISALSDNIRDVEKSRTALERIRRAYRREKDEIYREREEDCAERRYFHIAFGQRRFIASILYLMQLNGDLTEKEYLALQSVADGNGLDYVAEKFSMTRTRARQLIEKAFRKSNSLDNIAERLKKMEDLERENRELRESYMHLQGTVLSGDGTTEALVAVLSRKIEDCGFSVRVNNVCRTEGLATIKDICRLSEREFRSLRNMGYQSVSEVKEYLRANGVSFGMQTEELFEIYRNKKC